jgi:putative ABC transport system permease protein
MAAAAGAGHVSALNRKAWGDLRRHRARSLLTMFTLSLAVASLATLAVPGLEDRAMDRQIQADRLYDVAVATRDLTLTPAQLGALGRLPGVAAADAAVRYPTQVTVGGRRQPATIWGLDLAWQPVDAIRLLTGRLPRPGEVLADAGNGAVADLSAAVGTSVEVRDSDGGQTLLRVSGTAHGLATSPSPAVSSDDPVFYASEATVRSLAGLRGSNYLAFRLADNAPGAEASAIAEVHAYLERLTGAEPFVGLPTTLGPGDWPGQSYFDDVIALFYFITVLAVCCALFLIASTMNTLIVEQAGEIAILKTLGGRRRQIAGVMLRPAALLGGAGAILGAGLGIGIAYELYRYFALALFDIPVGFAVSVPVVAASLVLGPALAVAASLPGLWRALRRPVAETLADRGVTGYGTGWLDRLAARSRLLSGPARMGVRNALRHKRRSAATVAQVAVATGLALALFAAGRSIAVGVSQVYGAFHYAISVDAGNGSPLLGPRARSVAAATPGITRVEPVAENSVEYRGAVYEALGLGPDPLYQYRLSAGHWFTAAYAAAVPAVVLGPAVARASRASIGRELTLGTAAGPTRVRVVGIDTGQSDNGGVVYFPLAALQRLTGMGDATNVLWLTAGSTGHAAIDRAATAVAGRLAAAGYPVGTQELYVAAADNAAVDKTILTVIEALGLLVVAIALMGLVSALTMGVIERTREIGILRCLGARAGHIRRVFSAEGILLAAAGWAFGIPVGWLIYQALIAFVQHDFGVQAPVVFPAISAPAALVAVVAVALVVIRGPLHRATRIQPGGALRYQ